MRTGVVNEGSHLAVVVVVIWVDFLCLVILSAWQAAARLDMIHCSAIHPTFGPVLRCRTLTLQTTTLQVNSNSDPSSRHVQW